MKSALVLLGIVLGFAIAHAVNKSPEGKRFLSGLDARIEDFREAAVEGFRTRNAEVRALAPPGRRWRARLSVLFAIAANLVLYRTNRGVGDFNARRYARDVVANSDFRKYDDGLKMTIDIDDAGAARIEARLAAAAAEGICRYGLHRQSQALVTCIVPSIMTRDHVHFVDGAEGGYNQAARRMKATADPDAGAGTGGRQSA